MTRYCIGFTGDQGIVVRKTDEEAGHYIGFDAPWQGEPNQFVADTFSDAKREAKEFLEYQIQYLQDWLADLKGVRRSHVQ